MGILNIINHSMLSSAGKSLHLTEVVLYSAVVGKRNASTSYYDQFHPKTTETVVLLIATAFILTYGTPRLQETTLADKVFKTMVTTIIVYAWAFSFINNLWEFFYYDVPHGQAIYCAIMAACCL